MKETFHYSHHRVEAIKARRRFASLNLVLFAIAAVTIGAQYAASHAATPPTTASLDGVKIDTSGSGTYGGSTTGPYSSAAVSIRRASNGAATTSSNNPFGFSSIAAIAAGENYTISTATTAVGSYKIKGTTWEDGSLPGWNAQTTGFKSGASRVEKIVPGHYYHMRFIYQYYAPVTPPPTVAPTPVKPPTPIPRTPVPTVRPTARPSTPAPVSGGAAATPVSAPAIDTTPPSDPTAVQALVVGSNALVKLSWTASTDDNAVTAYRIERSTDQATWNVLSNETDVSYEDSAAAYGVHYYYRVSALDAAGNQSGFGLADASTPDFTANSNTSNDQTFMSDDSLVSVTIPSGAFDDAADCSVLTGTNKINSGKLGVIAGPFQLVCKDSSGTAQTVTKEALKWSYNVKSKLKGYSKPFAAAIDDSGSETPISSSVYASKTGIVTFTSVSLGTTAVLASVKAGFPTTIVIIIFLVLLVIVGFVIMLLRRGQKSSYDDYLKNKYYNL